MQLPDLETARRVISTLADYHSVQDAEADAMDYADCAKWHASFAKWLNEDGLKSYQEALAIEEKERTNGTTTV